MLRIIHTADVHLGARHDDLGEQAAAQRERQFAAFKAAVDLALTEKVDLFLIAGDLFDSNMQPRRSVERVAAELARLAESRIRTVIIPGTHDVFDRASIYRAYDLAAMAGVTAATAAEQLVTVLDPDHPSVHLVALETVVHGRVFADQACAAQPAAGRRRRRGRRARRRETCHVARRDGPRLDRHPGQDRPRRGRDHDRGDRRDGARLPRPRVTGTPPRAARPGPSRTRIPAPRRRSPSTRTGRARSCWSSSTRRPASGPRRSRSDRSDGPGSPSSRSMPPRSPASRPWSTCCRPRPIRTSSSTSGWSASAGTSSTSTSMRSKWPWRPPSSRSASATPRCRR